MKPLPILAITLIALGVLACGYQGRQYTTTKDIQDIGLPTASPESARTTLPLAPVLGALAVGGGLLLLVRPSPKA